MTDKLSLTDPGVSYKPTDPTLHTSPPKRSRHRKKPRREGVARRSSLAVHEQEFVRMVIAPKLYTLLQESDFTLDITKLATAYNAAHSTSFSPTTVKKWVHILGWKCERVARWTIGSHTRAHASPEDVLPDVSPNLFDPPAPAGVAVKTAEPPPGYRPLVM